MIVIVAIRGVFGVKCVPFSSLPDTLKHGFRTLPVLQLRSPVLMNISALDREPG